MYDNISADYLQPPEVRRIYEHILKLPTDQICQVNLLHNSTNERRITLFSALASLLS